MHSRRTLSRRHTSSMAAGSTVPPSALEQDRLEDVELAVQAADACELLGERAAADKAAAAALIAEVPVVDLTDEQLDEAQLQVGASLPHKRTLAPCCAYLRAGCLTLAPRLPILSSARVYPPARSSRCAGRRADGDAKLDGAPAAARASLGPPWKIAGPHVSPGSSAAPVAHVCLDSSRLE